MTATILTVTMNPAVDITTTTELVRPTDKNRCSGVRYDPGGGGVNVARVAHVLGVQSHAIFPSGGPTGGTLCELLADCGIPFTNVPIQGSTRESFTVEESVTGLQYRFVLPGPTLTEADQVEVLRTIGAAIQGVSYVVASGSLPPGVAPEFYQRIGDTCRLAGARYIVDTSGRGLTHIGTGALLVKPSVRELRQYSGRALETDLEQVDAARQLIAGGCTEAVVVSRGSLGALLVTAHSSYQFPAIADIAGSGVGAGDAMVAGMVVALAQGWPLTKAVRLGIAAGAAMLMTPGTAPCTRADVERFFEAANEPSRID